MIVVRVDLPMSRRRGSWSTVSPDRVRPSGLHMQLCASMEDVESVHPQSGVVSEGANLACQGRNMCGAGESVDGQPRKRNLKFVCPGQIAHR